MLATRPLLALLLALLTLLSHASASVDKRLLALITGTDIIRSGSYTVSSLVAVLPSATLAPVVKLSSANTKAKDFFKTFNARDDGNPYPYNAAAIADCWKSTDCTTLYDTILSHCYYDDTRPQVTNPNDSTQSYAYQKCVCGKLKVNKFLNAEGKIYIKMPNDPISSCLACLSVKGLVNTSDVTSDIQNFCLTGEPNEFLFLNKTLGWLNDTNPLHVLNPTSTHVSPPLAGPITAIVQLSSLYSTDIYANQATPIGDTTVTTLLPSTPTSTNSSAVLTASTTISSTRTPNVAIRRHNPLSRFTIEPRRHKNTQAWKYLRWVLWWAAVVCVSTFLTVAWIFVERRRTQRVWVGMEKENLQCDERSMQME